MPIVESRGCTSVILVARCATAGHLPLDAITAARRRQGRWTGCALSGLQAILPPCRPWRVIRPIRAMEPMTEPPAKPFAHLDAPNAELYRGVMGVFVAAKRRFLVHLRPEDVLESLRGPEGPPVEAAAVEAALKQLESWRNLRADPDTSRVTMVDDFYRPRYLYQ